MQCSYVTFNEIEIMAHGYDQHLLSVKEYAPHIHSAFTDLIRHRIELDVHYRSLYGEKFLVTLCAKPHNSTT